MRACCCCIVLVCMRHERECEDESRGSGARYEGGASESACQVDEARRLRMIGGGGCLPVGG